MNYTSVQVGSRVYVIASGPFKGLRGTVQSVDAIPSFDESCYFYLVKLERSYIPDPVWFQHEEVEVIAGEAIASSFGVVPVQVHE